LRRVCFRAETSSAAKRFRPTVGSLSSPHGARPPVLASAASAEQEGFSRCASLVRLGLSRTPSACRPPGAGASCAALGSRGRTTDARHLRFLWPGSHLVGGRIMNFSLTAWPCYRLKSLAWKGLGMGRARPTDGSPFRDILVNVLGPKRQPDRRCSLGGLLSSFERTGLG